MNFIRSSRIFIFLFAIFLWTASSTLAQQFPGRITGTVRDTQGAAVGGATVKLTNPSTGLARSVACLVLERDRKPYAVALDLAVLHSHILPEDLGDSQVAHGLCRSLDRIARGCLPGLAAHADHLGDSVDAVSHRNHPLLDVWTRRLSHISSEGGRRAARLEGAPRQLSMSGAIAEGGASCPVG